MIGQGGDFELKSEEKKAQLPFACPASGILTRAIEIPDTGFRGDSFIAGIDRDFDLCYRAEKEA